MSYNDSDKIWFHGSKPYSTIGIVLLLRALNYYGYCAITNRPKLQSNGTKIESFKLL